MIEIENRQNGPIQLVVRSMTHNGGFTTLNIPGIGSGKNVYTLEDERMTEYVERVKKDGLITTRYVNKVN